MKKFLYAFFFLALFSFIFGKTSILAYETKSGVFSFGSAEFDSNRLSPTSTGTSKIAVQAGTQNWLSAIIWTGAPFRKSSDYYAYIYFNGVWKQAVTPTGSVAPFLQSYLLVTVPAGNYRNYRLAAYFVPKLGSGNSYYAGNGELWAYGSESIKTETSWLITSHYVAYPSIYTSPAIYSTSGNPTAGIRFDNFTSFEGTPSYSFPPSSYIFTNLPTQLGPYMKQVGFVFSAGGTKSQFNFQLKPGPASWERVTVGSGNITVFTRPLTVQAAEASPAPIVITPFPRLPIKTVPMPSR